jgi:hypothetical protein
MRFPMPHAPASEAMGLRVTSLIHPSWNPETSPDRPARNRDGEREFSWESPLSRRVRLTI